MRFGTVQRVQSSYDVEVLAHYFDYLFDLCYSLALLNFATLFMLNIDSHFSMPNFIAYNSRM